MYRQVRAAFQQVRGKRMSQGMDAEMMRDTRSQPGRLEDLLHRARGQVPFRVGAGKEPGALYTLVHVSLDGFQRHVGKQRITIFPSLAPAYAHHPAVFVQIIRSEFDDLAHPQAGGVDHHQYGHMLDVADGSQQFDDGFSAQDLGQTLFFLGLATSSMVSGRCRTLS